MPTLAHGAFWRVPPPGGYDWQVHVSELEFGRYEPLFRIAAGGMAEVHAARIRGEAGFEKLVAVKRMLPHLADDPEFVAMFLDEGRLAANIHSPHVVSTLDLGRGADGSLYIVMDLVVGIALSTMLRAAVKAQRPLPVPVACEIIAQAATGLDDAHEARTPTGVHLGIVHRDVSPQNVLVGADGRTRMVDFGVARAVLRQSHTSTGTLKGKFGYFSPEQAAARELDRRSDVFALGVVAWETLIGRRLFEGDNPLETITRVRAMPIGRPSELRPDVPDAVSKVVMRALERDPARRWDSAGAFASALRAALGTPVSTRDVAALVADIGGPTVREMQARIEAAMAGDHLVTKALRTPAKHPLEEPGQATPSGMPARVADLPTLVRTIQLEVPLEPAAPTASTAPASGRWWIAGIAVSAVIAVLIGVAMASQSSPEPVATPLATPIIPVAHVDAVPVATTIEPIPPPVTTAAPPPTEPGVRAPIDRTPRPRPTITHTPDVPPTTTTHVETPPPATRTVVAPPPTTTARTVTPPPPATRAAPPPTDSTRHPAGLAGDDAFDQGI